MVSCIFKLKAYYASCVNGDQQKTSYADISKTLSLHIDASSDDLEVVLTTRACNRQRQMLFKE